LQKIIFKLWDHGVTIQTISPEESYEPGCSKDIKFIVLILYLRQAWGESQRKADLISAKWEAWRQRVAKGERIPPPGLMPYWIVWAEVANALAVRPDARAAIKLVFKLAAEGLGFERTVNRLNTLGIAPFGKRADRWTRSYVCKLLRCRSLLG